MKHIRTVVICIAALLTVGCGITEEVKVTIIKSERIECGDDWLCGCVNGIDQHTVIKTEDGRIDNVCAYIGEVGDVVTGYWTRGHFDAINNGFHLNK